MSNTSVLILSIFFVVVIKAQFDLNYLKSRVSSEFFPKHAEYRNKFEELPYITGRDIYPVLYSLTLAWDKTKYRVLELFNPLPCGNCKEYAHQIERDINFNIDAFREEYTVDRLRLRLIEGFRDGYERLMLPAKNYMDEFKPYNEQLKNVLPCWAQYKNPLINIFEESYNFAKGNITQKISEFAVKYQVLGTQFDDGVKNATDEAKQCTSYSQGFGYCQYLYVRKKFDDFFT